MPAILVLQWRANTRCRNHVFDYIVTVALGSTLATFCRTRMSRLPKDCGDVMLVSMQRLVAKGSELRFWRKLSVCSAGSVAPWRARCRGDVERTVTEVEVDIAIRMRGFGSVR